MKKSNIKKLQFNSLSITELNAMQMRSIMAGDNNPTSTNGPYTQTGPPDLLSSRCGEIAPIAQPDVSNRK
jgi:hypothetical protein